MDDRCCRRDRKWRWWKVIGWVCRVDVGCGETFFVVVKTVQSRLTGQVQIGSGCLCKFSNNLVMPKLKVDRKGRARTSDQAGKSPRFALPLSYFP